MTCSFEEELTAYVDGELARGRQDEVAAHLGGCPDCQRTEGALRKTLALLGALPEPQLGFSSASAQMGLMSRLEEERQGPFGRWVEALRRPWLVGPVAAAALTGAFAFVFLVHPGRQVVAPETAPQGDAELVAELEMFENYDVVGLDGVEDLEVVERLHELEAR